MYNEFDKLNRETKEYNNGFGGRKMGWYDATNIYNTPHKSKSNGHYDGRGIWVED